MKGIETYIANIEPRLLQHVTGKMGELIQAIQENKFLSEEALLKFICDNKHERKYYHNLKSRTIKMLQALAIVSGSKGESEVKKKLDLCRKNFTIGQKFLGKGERQEGLRLIKQAYRIAVDYDFVHMACELSSVLYHHNVYYQRNSKKAAEFASQVQHYGEAYLADKKAEHYFYQAISQMPGSLPTHLLKEAVDSTSPFSSKSLKSKTYHLMLTVLYGFRVADYHLIIESCEGMLDYYTEKKGGYQSYYHFFYTNMGIAQIATKDFQKAETTFINAEQYAHSKSINEYIIALYRTINALHAGQYDIAYQLYRQNRNCKFELIKEQFAIIEAYLCFLSHMGYLQIEGKFRIGKYLNETFKAQSDKEGSNITILIAELLVYLARNRGKFIDRVEAIQNYSYRHLKGSDTKRAKRFIKILCLMPRANFNPIALNRIAVRQIKYIQDHPIYLGDNVAIEIIPFGDLLGMIMRALERRVA